MVQIAGGKCSLLCMTMNSGSRRTRPYHFRRCKARPTETETEIDSLPDELLSYILLRVPAHHLHQSARFVCRRWSLIINSGHFVTAQLQHSTYGLLLAGEGARKRHPILITAAQGRIVLTKLNYICRQVLLTSANGLAAELDCSLKTNERSIQGMESTITITNPATKQSLLPPSLLRGADDAYYFAMGIGFAMRSSKYKLVLPHYHFSNYTSKYSLSILTLGVDKSWRDIDMVESVPEDYWYYLKEPPLITEGFMHWMRYGCDHILIMDVETETFRLSMRSPHLVIGAWRQPVYHLSTGKFLSLLIDQGDFLWEVWGMESETGEWRKVLPDINLGLGGAKMRLQKFAPTRKDPVLVPFGWVNYPEVLAFHFYSQNRTCIFYNLHTYQITSAELPLSCSSFRRFVHKNSLERFG